MEEIGNLCIVEVSRSVNDFMNCDIVVVESHEEYAVEITTKPVHPS